MSTILYLQVSPRGERSYSSAVAKAFLAEYAKSRPGDTIVTRNLFEADLPPFDGDALNMKYRILHGEDATEAEKGAWKRITDFIDEFKSCDKLVISTPMWNFGLPYRLKQYLDIIMQPAHTFGYDPQKGYFGLVTDKPTFIAYARGGEYPAGTPGEAYDFQTKYLEFLLNFMGITDVRTVVVEPTLQDKETAEHRKTAAIAKALDLAGKF